MTRIRLAVELEDIDLPTWYHDADDLLERYSDEDSEDGYEL